MKIKTFILFIFKSEKKQNILLMIKISEKKKTKSETDSRDSAYNIIQVVAVGVLMRSM